MKKSYSNKMPKSSRYFKKSVNDDRLLADQENREKLLKPPNPRQPAIPEKKPRTNESPATEKKNDASSNAQKGKYFKIIITVLITTSIPLLLSILSYFFLLIPESEAIKWKASRTCAKENSKEYCTIKYFIYNLSSSAINNVELNFSVSNKEKYKIVNSEDHQTPPSPQIKESRLGLFSSELVSNSCKKISPSPPNNDDNFWHCKTNNFPASGVYELTIKISSGEPDDEFKNDFFNEKLFPFFITYHPILPDDQTENKIGGDPPQNMIEGLDTKDYLKIYASQITFALVILCLVSLTLVTVSLIKRRR